VNALRVFARQITDALQLSIEAVLDERMKDLTSEGSSDPRRARTSRPCAV